jgi:CubicO group peptidase (beta-lactamase class C family)
MLLLGCLVQSGAQTPAIWPVLCEYKDGAGNTIVPAAGRPFVLWVHYRYDNPTASTYRIRWDFGGATNYSGDINWGAGSPPGSYYYVLAAWTTLENAGTNVFTVRADCDDALAGAPLGIKTMSIPLTAMSPLSMYDFSGWDAFFRDRIPDDGAGGYQWAGMENGQVVAQGAGGFARAPWEPVNPGVRMSTRKPMILASVSKLITRVGLARLWEMKCGMAGAFDYTNRVAPYLSGLVSNIHPSFLPVTIQQLRDHTSGLTNDFSELGGLQTVLTNPVGYASGITSWYLNGNYYLLATVMSVIAGQPYDDFMRTNVFQPLGMWHTDDHATEAEPTMFYGPAAMQRPGVMLEVTGTQNAGAGGWWSTVEDLELLMRSLRYSTLLEKATSDREGFNRGVWAADGGITWIWNNTYGQLSTRVFRYNDTLDAILLINSSKGPAGNHLDEVFRLPQPGVRLQARQEGSQLVCSYFGHAGFSYSLDSSGGCRFSDWTNRSILAGSNAVQNVRFPIGNAQEYFRVLRN